MAKLLIVPSMLLLLPLVGRLLLSLSLPNYSLVVSFLIAIPGVLVAQLIARYFLMRRQTL